MSGSGSGGGFSSPSNSCETLTIETQLSSPKPIVIARINVGEKLEISTQQVGATTVVLALHNGEVAGGIASPEVLRLRECIAEGFGYVATVVSKNDGQVRVRVHPQ